jgi:uncharacterized protein (TIGR01777 family)
MRIAISGASGLLGTALCERLHGEHEIIRLVRRPASSMLERRWDPAEGWVEGLGLSDIDAVINLSGADIGASRWTRARRRELLTSRVGPTQTLTRLIAAEERPQLYLCASGVDYYGSTGDRVIDESAPNGSGFLADLARQWEAAAAGAGVRTVHLRTGLALTRKGGYLARLLPFYRAGLGGRIGNGLMWLPVLALDDWLAAVVHILGSDLSGPVNLTGPDPVVQADFIEELGRMIHRPTLLPTPLPAVRVVYGADLVDQLLLASHRVVPKSLQESGFEFRHPRFTDALAAALA